MTTATPSSFLHDEKDATDIVIACCRDESDIIHPFIDFYLEQGFDRVCLIDNGSQDSTVTQILSHPAQGRVLLQSDLRVGYDLRLLDYYHTFANLASRWIFFIDVDEFVLIPGGIKRFACQLPREVTVLAMSTSEMIPFPESEQALSPLMTIRRQAEVLYETKVVWKKGVVKKIYCGKHAVEGDPIIVERREDLFIRHYHTRSQDQFRRKLQNRIETETLIANMPDAGDSLSMFSRAERKEWIEESKALLENNGWALEQERFASMLWMEDTAIRDWYCARARLAVGACPESARGASI